MLRHAFAFSFVLFAACRPPAHDPASAKPAASSAETPVVVASVSALPSASAASMPAPSAAAEGTEQELEEIATAVCAAAYREEGGKKHIGCRRPPPFKGKGRESDGKMIRFESEDLATFCGISVSARGSFTGPNKKETLLTIDNCRDDDSDEGWNGSVPGSAAVVAYEDGRWRGVTAAKSVNTGECSVIRRVDHRDTLICKSRYDAYSIGTDYYFFSLDFAGGTPMARTVAHVYDDVGSYNCAVHEGQGMMAPTGLTSVKSVSMTTRDINGDGTPDVVLEVERSHVEPSAPFDAKVRALCKQGKPLDGVMPTATKHRLEILSDGTRFRPTPAAKKLLDEWRAASPDVTQLEGAAPPKVDR